MNVKHLIVGTAGHVDHGKTALIKTLTGVDTDRLAEEKKRGISIDIGFAVLRYENELVLGIVDVPGHERFLKNMLAGTGGVDLAMLVIAADEGIMPQTREHMEMLACFGVTRGVAVLSKIDKVDKEWLNMVEEEVRNFLADSFLAAAPLCRVSAVTGEGMEELRRSLQGEAEKLTQRDRRAPFHLWIDRAFYLKGQGLIVTGSALSGTLQSGGEVELQPDGISVRIREIQTHNQSVTEIGAGQRASFNITGLSLPDVERGKALSEAGFGRKSRSWDAWIQWRNTFPSGTRVRFHLGTGEFIGRLAHRGSLDGKEGLVRLYLEQPIMAALGERGLLRRYSPQDLIGGVTLLAPHERPREPEHLLSLAANVKQQDVKGILTDLLALAGEPLELVEWTARAGYINKDAVKNAVKDLLASGRVRQAGKYYITAKRTEVLMAKSLEILAEYHRIKPNEAGIARETLRQRLHIPEGFADWFFQEAGSQGYLELRKEFAALPTHATKHEQERSQLVDELERLIPANEIVEITPEWLAVKFQRPLAETKIFFDGLVRERTLIRLAGVHVYRKTIQYIGEAIHSHFQQHKTLSVGELRDLIHVSRRLAIPLLEYFDMNKITVRQGDVRVPGANLKNLSE